MMRLPLTHWMLHGDSLPEQMLARGPAGFVLPGAAALDAFAGLLGGEADGAADGAAQDSAAEQDSAPFSLPGMLPEGVNGCVSLTREIDFGRLSGDRALLECDALIGKGEILLDGERLTRFDSTLPSAQLAVAAAERTGMPCRHVIDLTQALCLGRRCTLTLRFEAARPAGIGVPVFLVTTQHAHLARVTLTPDVRSKTMALCARLHAKRAGRYVLRVQPVDPEGTSLSIRQTRYALSEGETRETIVCMEIPGGRFVPGRAYAAPAVKAQLFFCPADTDGEGTLCDEALLMCGYPAREACAFVPLTAQEAGEPPSSLARRLAQLHIPAVGMKTLPSDATLSALCRAGVSACLFVPEGSAVQPLLTRYPHVCMTGTPLAQAADTPEAAAWQLCSMTAFPRTVDALATPGELLREAAGRALDPEAEGVRSVLSWLVMVAVRLRAEAARQGRFSGALCAEGALENEEIREALRTAFAPLHLSALPLYGAWWTGMRFSAVLHAFLPEGETRRLTAEAVLEDENGGELARLDAPCAAGGALGVLEAALPHEPCVLTLSCRLLCGGDILEQHALAVYVGERGPLEAAFA